jgi:hypothetical protein
MTDVQHRCVDCKAESPPTDSSYSLIGLAGWRMLRAALPDGTLESRWRCPACWVKHKQKSRVTTLVNSPMLMDSRRRSGSQ